MKSLTVIFLVSMLFGSLAFAEDKQVYKFEKESTARAREKKEAVRFLKSRLKRHEKLNREEIIADLLKDERDAIDIELAQNNNDPDLKVRLEAEFRNYEDRLNGIKEKSGLLAFERHHIKEVRGPLDYRMFLMKSVFEATEEAPGAWPAVIVIGALALWPLDMASLPVTIPIWIHTSKSGRDQ